MILLALITMVLFTIKLMFLPLPNVPGLDSSITDAVGYVTDLINNAAGFVSYIFTPPLITFIIVSTILLFNMDTAYKAVMWTLGKIPWINIH